MDPEPMYVLLSTPTGNLLGEFPTRAEGEAARERYVALDARNAHALEIVFDDGRGGAPADDELPRAS